MQGSPTLSDHRVTQPSLRRWNPRWVGSPRWSSSIPTTPRNTSRRASCLRALVTLGNYLIVEDTNINGHPVLPGWGPGPMEAVEEFMQEAEDFVVDQSREEFLLTFNPRGYLRRRGATPEGDEKRQRPFLDSSRSACSAEEATAEVDRPSPGGLARGRGIGFSARCSLHGVCLDDYLGVSCGD